MKHARNRKAEGVAAAEDVVARADPAEAEVVRAAVAIVVDAEAVAEAATDKIQGPQFRN